jgi:hypothetical protein
MKQEELLFVVVDHLCDAAIPYMVTGSYGSAFYGEQRSTNDIDVVIDPTVEQIQRFVRGFDERYYVNEKTAIAAVLSRSMFNVVDTYSGWKVDLIVRKQRQFSEEEFRRRGMTSLFGRTIFMLSAEDAILSKLEWYKKGASDRQLEDVVGILVGQREDLDLNYLNKWAAELGVSEQLSTLLNQLPEQDE